MREPSSGVISLGPLGFGLARHLRALGVPCEVIAPEFMPERATVRVKTDRRDARKLAEDIRSGSLTPVHVPTLEEEAFQDLVRAQVRPRRKNGRFWFLRRGGMGCLR